MQVFPEHFVAVIAAEPSRLFESGLGKAALGTSGGVFQLVSARGAGRTCIHERIGQGKTSWIRDAFFVRAALAQVHLVHLPLKNLSEKYTGRLLAEVASHFVAYIYV